MNPSHPPRTFGTAVLLALVATSAATAGRAETPSKASPTAPKGRAVRVKPNPMAQRLCDALHTLPATRKSACCGTTAPSLAGVCALELDASLERGAVALDATGIDQCVAETARQLEGCDWVTPLLPKPPTVCRTLVQGQLKAGTACRSSLECHNDLFCRGVGPGKAGVCAKSAPARTRCEFPADPLASHTRADDGRHRACEGVCVKGQCLAFSPAGGACQSSAACAPGLQCISGRCEDRALPGIRESCAGHTSCVAGAYCQAGVCAALKNTGEACTLPSECRAFACVMAPGAAAGTCGEPCGTGPRTFGGPAPSR